VKITAVFQLVLVAVLAALTYMAKPAPRGIGSIELAIAFFLFMFISVTLVNLLVLHRFRVGLYSKQIYMILSIYFLIWILSALLSLARGTEPYSVFRSVVPYVLFVPLVMRTVSTKSWGVNLAFILTSIGFIQAIDIWHLYVSNVSLSADLTTVIQGRITLLESRTTVPYFLAAIFLPLSFAMRFKSSAVRIAWVFVSFFSSMVPLLTQTRSQLLAVVCGLIAFAWYAGLAYSRRRSFFQRARMLGLFLVVALILSWLISSMPIARHLAIALYERARIAGDNGRITEEWLPALQVYLDGDIIGLLMGIGSGTPFITASGLERTYIHNLTLYTLVYTGVIGLVATGMFYWLVTKALLRLYARFGDPLYLGYFSLVIALFLYAQFFAVHKLLSFNLMIIGASSVVAGLYPLGRSLSLWRSHGFGVGQDENS